MARTRERVADERRAERARQMAERGWVIRYGEYGVLEHSPDGLTVQCHYCGKWVRGLGQHGWMEHGIRAKEYRAETGLMAKTGLVSVETRQRYADVSAQNRATVNQAENLRKLLVARYQRIACPLPYRPQREEAKIVQRRHPRTDVFYRAMSQQGVSATQARARQRQMTRIVPTCAWCHNAMMRMGRVHDAIFCSRACYRRSLTGVDTPRLQKGRAVLAARAGACS